jgi:hypothetical protein
MTSIKNLYKSLEDDLQMFIDGYFDEGIRIERDIAQSLQQDYNHAVAMEMLESQKDSSLPVYSNHNKILRQLKFIEDIAHRQGKGQIRFLRRSQ